jgi:hypothetical protein
MAGFVYDSGTVHAVTPVQASAQDQAVRRLANSKTFQNHPTLRQLLLYLAARTAGGNTGELKEYVIGVEAFAKPASYDPQKDASVRVQVSRLRKCIADYYGKECPDDPVRIEIPKGQFLILFQFRDRDGFQQHTVSEAAHETPSAIMTMERRLRGMTRACVVLSIVALAATAGLVASWTVAVMGSHRTALNAALMAFWGPYIRDDRAVLVVLGAPLFAKYTTAETGVFFRDPRVNEWEQAASSLEISKIGSAVGGAQITPSRIYTGVGEATGAFLLSRMFSQSKHEISLRRSHALSLDDFKDRNVIVLGAPKHNAHLKHLPVQQQFAFANGSIRNLRPLPGEPEMFRPTFAVGYEELEEDHGLISRFPGLHGIGYTTLLAGSSTEATLAAVEFVTQPRYAGELAQKLRGADGTMPRAFQVVVRAKFKSQTPVEISYVSHRLLDPDRTEAASERTAAAPRVTLAR